MVRYMVQKGDTLGDIAVKYGTTVQAIVSANGIRNPNMIYPGQMLKIPSPHYAEKSKSSYSPMHHSMHHSMHSHSHSMHPSKHYEMHDEKYHSSHKHNGYDS
ncbi:LysM peptidoglycan-binding domain-containing protein [Alicyclobacillus sp. TC]|uniref:LysM domain-containing protein n=2 Tax=Alicyclobacillus tolerans TaxID=90970 RepID=A0A1M6SQB7_9BACL|nr:MULTISPECIES: LysM domain-containing protein [Alicyclobacillus]MDP9727153.1 LysM repeat protein [Alicyclobacillus tengchongensis]QRF22921.1 LysM peptidoglycan-binding domain-containing protein [Alicyclobacillus sp. TC]SHK46768.1 LysM domain-containing protein [Alicyclobacillus montanus]